MAWAQGKPVLGVSERLPGSIRALLGSFSWALLGSWCESSNFGRGSIWEFPKKGSFNIVP